MKKIVKVSDYSVSTWEWFNSKTNAIKYSLSINCDSVCWHNTTLHFFCHDWQLQNTPAARCNNHIYVYTIRLRSRAVTSKFGARDKQHEKHPKINLAGETPLPWPGQGTRYIFPFFFVPLFLFFLFLILHSHKAPFNHWNCSPPRRSRLFLFPMQHILPAFSLIHPMHPEVRSLHFLTWFLL